MSSTDPNYIFKLQAEYVDTVGASALTGLSPRALDTLRYRGLGPRYLRVGSRIRYRIEDLRAWMERDAVPTFNSAANHEADDLGGENG